MKSTTILAIVALVSAQDDMAVLCDTISDCKYATVEGKKGDDLACGSADWSDYKMPDRDRQELFNEAKKAGKDGAADFEQFVNQAIEAMKNESDKLYRGKKGMCGPETYCGLSKADWNGIRMVCSKELNGGRAIPDGGWKIAAKAAEKKKVEMDKKRAAKEEMYLSDLSNSLVASIGTVASICVAISI